MRAMPGRRHPGWRRCPCGIRDKDRECRPTGRNGLGPGRSRAGRARRRARNGRRGGRRAPLPSPRRAPAAQGWFRYASVAAGRLPAGARAAIQPAWSRSGLVMARRPAAGSSFGVRRTRLRLPARPAPVGKAMRAPSGRRDDPVGAGDDGLPRRASLRLLELPGGQAQPDRRAVRPLHETEGLAHEDRQFVDMGRLEAASRSGGHADQRRVDRLVLAALRAPASGRTASRPAGTARPGSRRS